MSNIRVTILNEEDSYFHKEMSKTFRNPPFRCYRQIDSVVNIKPYSRWSKITKEELDKKIAKELPADYKPTLVSRFSKDKAWMEILGVIFVLVGTALAIFNVTKINSRFWLAVFFDLLGLFLMWIAKK